MKFGPIENQPKCPAWQPSLNEFQRKRAALRRIGLESCCNASHATLANVEKVNLSEKFAQFSEHWSPRIAGELNGQHVKLVKFQGEFVWHHHNAEDELFLVVTGGFRMEFRDRTVHLKAGEFMIVPRGVEHRPVADQEVEVLLFEPAGTVNTGTAGGERTVHDPARI